MGNYAVMHNEALLQCHKVEVFGFNLKMKAIENNTYFFVNMYMIKLLKQSVA